jgi:hypothetical protein
MTMRACAAIPVTSSPGGFMRKIVAVLALAFAGVGSAALNPISVRK